jgi:hypothetical protein
MTLFLLLKLFGIVLILKGVAGLLSITREVWKKKNGFKGRKISALTNGHIFLTGCFLLTIPFLEIKLHQLYLLGALYGGLSTIFWIFVSRSEKDK